MKNTVSRKYTQNRCPVLMIEHGTLKNTSNLHRIYQGHNFGLATLNNAKSGPGLIGMNYEKNHRFCRSETTIFGVNLPVPCR